MKEIIDRHAKLEKDLIEYHPKRWRLNNPYTFRREDFVPALSGAIGKVALVA